MLSVLANRTYRHLFLAQIIALGLNIGQAYLLQHLPARRRDRLDEQAMPRAPLF